MTTPRPSFRLRDILPKGLYWRTILIILVPAALLQLIITLVFLDDHWQATSKRMSQGVASDVALIIQLYERNPTQENFEDLERLAFRPLRLEIDLQPDAPLQLPRCRAFGSVIDRYLTRALQDQHNRDVWYDSSCPGTQVLIRVPIDEGVLQLKAFRDRVQARSGPLFVAWIAGATLARDVFGLALYVGRKRGALVRTAQRIRHRAETAASLDRRRHRAQLRLRLRRKYRFRPVPRDAMDHGRAFARGRRLRSRQSRRRAHHPRTARKQ
jgi:hypothetical protein